MLTRVQVNEHQIPLSRLSKGDREAVRRQLRAKSMVSSVRALPGTPQWVFQKKVKSLSKRSLFVSSVSQRLLPVDDGDGAAAEEREGS